ncbi:MAG: alpha/beta hydrolase [Oscillospiraceae bacterium]|nr:alpha/beta hydrolase [Oscillospiraceae bacterium]
MRQTVIELKPVSPEYKNESGQAAALTLMIHDTQPERRFPMVIVVPGGCYTRCSKREGEPVAMRYYSYGYNAAVLDYSVKDKPFPTALLELREAVRYIRDNLDSLCCVNDITVVGFSAGGHLAASLGVYGGDDRPDRLILCYPVISSGEYGHAESVANIAPTPELAETVSLEKHITEDFPPSFIWHCADDKTVPVENSLMLAAELSRCRIPYELHVFPHGGHGIALCDITTVKDENFDRYIEPHAAEWFRLSLDFLGHKFDK